MIWVCIGRGHSQETMEKWFHRAMEADQDYLEACQAKLQYLHPKWHGQRVVMLAFGQQCAATKNWDSDIPLVVIQAREMLPWEYDRRREVWSDPETWADIRGVLREYEKRYPNSLNMRSVFLRYAWYCDKRQDAMVQNALIAGRYRRAMFDSDNEFRECVAQFSTPEMIEQSKQALQTRREREKRQQK